MYGKDFQIVEYEGINLGFYGFLLSFNMHTNFVQNVKIWLTNNFFNP
jgi:hypothetical protein